MANGTANITKAGMKMATGVATIGLDSAECGIEAVGKGGNAHTMMSNYVGGMTSKQVDKFTNVLATATGFD